MSRSLRKRLWVAPCLAAALALPVFADSLQAALAPVNNALQAGQADKALSLISALPQGGQNNAQALNLSCRVQFTLGRWDAAVRDCEQAARLEPQNAANHMWLGRALGQKASKASFISAFSLAKRVVSEFQKAAQLDPNDPQALFDLGSYYVEAPAVVGGGFDKAQGVLAQLDKVDPARAWELRAEMDKRRKNLAAAEDDLKKAISASRHPALQWASLARFYQDHKRWDEMNAALRSCETAAAHDPHASVALYDAAGVLLNAKRDPAQGARLLQQYLASPSKTEEAPAFVAYSRLAYFQQKMGDTANAQLSQAAALELAHGYQPDPEERR